MTLVISPSVVSHEVDTPTRLARIGWDTFVRNSTVTSSTGTVDGFPVDSVTRATTWERWQPSAMPSDLEFDAGEAFTADYIGIAAHTMGTQGTTFTFEYSTDGIEWDLIESVSPADDSAIMLLFTQTQARYWRLSFSGGTPTVGVVYIGNVLVMMRPLYGGHSPLGLSRNTTIRPNRSRKGQWLGRSIVREGESSSYTWEHLDPYWYRQNFDPFVESAREYPFFIAWRPDMFPQEVGYCWTNDDIRPSNMGIRGLMEVTLPVEAFRG